MSDTVYLGADTPPRPCDYCAHVDHVPVPRKAEYDARTLRGSWANLCAIHFKTETLGRLGTGYGQRLVYADAPEVNKSEQRSLIMAAVESGDFDAAEDLIGDGDFTEWL